MCEHYNDILALKPNELISKHVLSFLQIQDNGICVLIAMLGGVALCIGNMLMQYSLVFLGISLTEVVSASIAVVGGMSHSPTQYKLWRYLLNLLV